MKTSILRGLKSSVLLVLWLLLVQVLSLLLSLVGALILWLLHPGPYTPWWEWLLAGVCFGAFWVVMGLVTPDEVQLRPAGAVALLTVWTAVTSLLANVCILFVPQQACGSMLIELLYSLGYDSRAWYREGLAGLDSPIGSVLLSAVFGVGLFLRWKRAKAAKKM